MIRQLGNGKLGRVSWKNRENKSGGTRSRRLTFESLEVRQLLTVAAPTSVAFQPQTGQGTATLTSANNSAATATEELQFLVSGVTAGNTVKVFADGGTTAIASATVPAGATTVTVTTDGSNPLANGSHTFTATQTDTSSNVSAASPGDTLQVFSGLTVTVTSARATSAKVGTAFSYVYTLQTNASGGDSVTYSLPSTAAPTGMSFDSSTNTVTWTPTADQAGLTPSFTLSATDTAGNTVNALPVFVSVAAASGITVIAPPANVAVDAPVLVSVNDANTGTPHYTVTATSTSDPTGAHLTGTVLPQTNQVLKIVTDQGEMDLELFNNFTPNTVTHFVNLVNSGTFDPSKYTNFTGTFQLAVGTVETSPITFDATNLTATAANIQSALVAAGLTGATVTVASGAAAPTFGFNVTFSSSESPIQYVPAAKALPVSFSNSATASATTQTLTFTAPVPEFYRIISTFMNQGGVSGLGGATTIPDELNPNLRFTSSGLLAMANNGVDGNSSEFFITNPDDMNNGFLDFRYTIFGKLISGDAVRGAISTTPVEDNGGGEVSKPLTPPKILSMSVATQTTSGVMELKAGSGASGPYTVTISDGLGGTQTFTIDIGADNFDPPNPWVNAINGTDKIFTSAGAAATFTPTTGSADGSPVQVSVQTMLPIPAVSGAYVDTSFLASSTSSTYPPTNPNPNIKLTQNGSSYTVTPTAGYYGLQVLEVMGFNPVTSTSPATAGHGTFKLQVGSTTTAAISFDSTNLAGTAANIQSALRTAGFSGATVTVAQATTAPSFVFDVKFTASEPDIGYTADSTNPLPLTFSNAATAAATSQQITFKSTGASWDAGSGVNPVYRAFVPVYVAPPTPVLSSITSGGKTISGSTFNNNGTTATEFSFNINGVVSGATVSVYLDNGTTPLISGIATGTSITLTTTGGTANKIADGAHTFTVKQTIATPALTLYADWSPTSGPGTQFPLEASNVDSAASAGQQITIGLFVLATPVTKAKVGSLYTYVVQTNAPAGDSITVTPVTMPAGMTFDNVATFSWTPSSSQLNTSPAFQAKVSDSQGRTITIGPTNITVVIGLIPTEVPINATAGGNVTVSFSGNNVQVFDNVAKAVLSTQSFVSTDTVEVDLPALQTNNVVVVLPNGGAIPHGVFVNGAATSTNNQVTVTGTSGADNFTLAGNTVTANGLQIVDSTIQKLTLAGNGGSNYYTLNSSAVPLTIVNTSGQGTLDFSNDKTGVAVNLGLYKGQAQNMAGWGSSLSLNGVLSEIIGSKYSDILTGGPAAMTIIHSGAANDYLIGGSGNNILVGGGGNEMIMGGSGKNLLIAGSGTSTLYATGSSNIVFGGSTSFDTNDQALINLLNQGPLVMYGYNVRMALASIARNPALSASMLSFQDSGAHDTVFGSGLNNWYVLGKYGILKP
jgi:cyclophilin family peptidyl-prolyl cis-trans isomerase